MSFEDQDLLEELIVESIEHLTSIEPDLLTLEKEGDSVPAELVNRVFRAMHSIKGGFAFFGITNIVDLSHAMESVLMRVREGELKVTPEVTDALLAGVDKLRVLLDDVEGSDSVTVAEEMAPLKAILETQPGVIAPRPNAEGAATLTESEKREAPVEVPVQLAPPPPVPERKEEGPSSGRKEKHSEAAETIRVKVDLLDNLMNLAGELVLGRNQIKLALNSRYSEAISSTSSYKRLEDELARAQESVIARLQSSAGEKHQEDGSHNRATVIREFERIRDVFNQLLSLRLVETPGMSAVMQDVDLVTSELQSSIMNTRMQPVGSVFAKFPRIMRDLSKKMGKEIELTLIGEDVELDKSIIEALADPLTHLVRNSVDHGIERPEMREQAGKSRIGKVRLRAYHEGGQVNIDITDDGAGMDVEKLKQKALGRGILTEEAIDKLTEREALKLIFAPGFSTAETVSDVSGRGVGMDVVKTNIAKLGGTVEIESTLGEGTRINLRLPLTLAIIPSLIVGTAGRRYAVPQVNLEELVRVRGQDQEKQIQDVRGRPVLRLRGKLLPLVKLSDVLDLEVEQEEGAPEVEEAEGPAQDTRHRREACNVLVLKVGANRYGLIVESLLDNEEIVVKPLSSYVKECKHYAGSTIMGDGRVAMILDAAGIAEVAGLRFSELEEAEAQINRQRGTETEVQPLLLFRNSGAELFAISLALVARIEKVRRSDVERVGNKEYVKYDRSSMRILRLHDYLTVERPSEEPEEFFIIVPKLVKHPMGIVATKVEDILHTDADIDRSTVSGSGILGSAVLEGRLAVFLDIYSLFEVAEPDLYARKPSGEDAAGLEGIRILLAEDTAFFRSVEVEYLRSFGCVVKAVEDGAQAWEALSKEPFDLVLTDIEMPGMNGFDLTERIRATEHLKHLPVVAVTALRSEHAQKQGKEAGVDAYEVKLDKDRLHRALTEVLRKRREEQTWSGNSQHSTSEMPASA